MATTIRVQSVRGVGCKAGYPYFATGLYTVRKVASGKNRGQLVWALVASKGWHRSTKLDTCGRFDNAVEMTARHNQKVTAHQAAALTGCEAATALVKLCEMV